jgi:DNA-binding CsgD family transcriptional regulator
LLATGRSSREVATILNVSVKTVQTHRANVMGKLKLSTYSEMIQFAIRHRIIEVA